jgi:hypothetical protein
MPMLTNLRQSDIKILHKAMPLTAALTYNLFKVIGAVKVEFIYGVVTTALAAGVTNANLELYPDGGAAIPITLAAGTDISSAVVGSMVSKTNIAGVALTLSDATLGFIEEATGLIMTTFIVSQKTGGIDTYIRFTRAGAGDSGAISWYVEWVPLNGTGLLVAV